VLVSVFFGLQLVVVIGYTRSATARRIWLVIVTVLFKYSFGVSRSVSAWCSCRAAFFSVGALTRFVYE